MANNGFKVKNKISLKQSTTAGDTPGDIRYDGNGNLQLRDGTAEKTILDQDNSVTVSNKTLTSSTIDADNNTISNIGDEELKAGIDAAKIADGSVSNTEFQYVNGVTSAIQTQLDSKATTTALNDHINDTADAHAASAITNTPAGNLAATTVQAALDELQTDVDTRATSAALTSHTGASSGVHGVTGSVVGTTDTQDLSGKTFTDAITLEEQGSTPSNPSAGDKKLYAKNDGKLYTLDSGGNEIEVGSGSGGGGVLYINEDFETGVSNLVAYADAAGTSPVDGTGGSPTLAVAAETGSPLIGTTSAKITKDAANRQGEGAAIVSDTVDSAYSDKVHTVEFLWKTDANYADGDMSLWVVHPTTGTVEALYFRDSLGVYTNELPASSSSTLRVVSELTPIDSTYRIVLHVASTSATGYVVYVDNIQCGPQKLIPGTIVTEWQAEGAVTINGTVSNPTKSSTVTADTMYWRRVGDSMEIQYFYRQPNATGAAAGSGLYYWNIPNGLSIDTNKIDVTNSGSINTVGSATCYAGTGSDNQTGSVNIRDATSLVIVAGDDTSGDQVVGSGFLPVTGGAVYYSFRATVPISGWDAGAVLSRTQVDVATPIAAGRRSSSQSLTADTTNMTFDSSEVDSNNAFDGTTFTAPRTGRIMIDGMSRFTTSAQRAISVYINGTIDKTIGRNSASDGLLQFAGQVDVEKGDAITLRCDTTSTVTASVTANNHVSIAYTPDFSTFAVAQPSTSRKAVTSKTTTYTATIADEYILCDTSGGAWTLTLPTAVGNKGKEFVIKYTDSNIANALTVDGNGSETIDGSTTTTLNTQGETLKIISDGSNWEIVERKTNTSWTGYTPTFTGFGTPTGVDCEWRRVGDSIELLLRFTAGSSTAVAAEIDLPAGLTIDSVFTSNSCVVGAWHINNSSAISRKRGVLWLNSSYTNSVLFGNDDYTTSGTPFSTLTGSAVGSSILVTARATIKVSGWNS